MIKCLYGYFECPCVKYINLSQNMPLKGPYTTTNVNFNTIYGGDISSQILYTVKKSFHD